MVLHRLEICKRNVREAQWKVSFAKGSLKLSPREVCNRRQGARLLSTILRHEASFPHQSRRVASRTSHIAMPPTSLPTSSTALHHALGNTSNPLLSPPLNIPNSPFESFTISSKLRRSHQHIPPTNSSHACHSPTLKHTILHLIRINPPRILRLVMWPPAPSLL